MRRRKPAPCRPKRQGRRSIVAQWERIACKGIAKQRNILLNHFVAFAVVRTALQWAKEACVPSDVPHAFNGASNPTLQPSFLRRAAKLLRHVCVVGKSGLHTLLITGVHRFSNVLQTPSKCLGAVGFKPMNSHSAIAGNARWHRCSGAASRSRQLSKLMS